ncbi:TIGR03809 family protein [Bradyrhizobium sp.]|uniref:TIGR03809 family protein n=1 Tax=Bradyrhizobium sp. TaxID=376 RepID=UPI003C3DE442
MTLQTDVAPGRDLLACWRELAEHRLEYLTRMFESGRWRRYYSELAFLENIREAKLAVDTWRSLSESHAQPKSAPIAASWSAPPRLSGLPKLAPRPAPIAAASRIEIPVPVEPIALAPRAEIPIAVAPRVAMAAIAPIAIAPRAETPVPAAPLMIAPITEALFGTEPPADSAAAEEAELAAPEQEPRAAPVDLAALERAMIDAFAPVPDLATIEQRYPLLRLTL